MENIDSKFPAPKIIEAVSSDGQGMQTLKVEQLGPEGATLTVSYPSLAEGDIVEAWEGTPGYIFNAIQIVPKGAKSLVFRVPKRTLENTNTLVRYQYFVRHEGDFFPEISEAVQYLKESLPPYQLPAPTLEKSESSRGTSTPVIKVDKLGKTEATLVIKYPEMIPGDKVEARIQIDGTETYTHTVTKGETQFEFKIPRGRFENNITTIAAYYVTLDDDNGILGISETSLYFKSSGYSTY